VTPSAKHARQLRLRAPEGFGISEKSLGSGTFIYSAIATLSSLSKLYTHLIPGLLDHPYTYTRWYVHWIFERWEERPGGAFWRVHEGRYAGETRELANRCQCRTA
jgi:hypothetical protein